MNHKAFQEYLATGKYVPTMDAAFVDGQAAHGLTDYGSASFPGGRMPKSLAEHDKVHHPHGFDPKKDHCKFRDTLAKGDQTDDLGATTPTQQYLDATKKGERKQKNSWILDSKAFKPTNTKNPYFLRSKEGFLKDVRETDFDRYPLHKKALEAILALGEKENFAIKRFKCYLNQIHVWLDTPSFNPLGSDSLAQALGYDEIDDTNCLRLSDGSFAIDFTGIGFPKEVRQKAKLVKSGMLLLGSKDEAAQVGKYMDFGPEIPPYAEDRRNKWMKSGMLPKEWREWWEKEGRSKFPNADRVLAPLIYNAFAVGFLGVKPHIFSDKAGEGRIDIDVDFGDIPVSSVGKKVADMFELDRPFIGKGYHWTYNPDENNFSVYF